MADKTKDAKKDDARMSSIAKTLNKVEDRLEKSENCDSVAEGLANAAKASELLSSVWTLPPTQLLRFHHDTKVSDIDGDSTPGLTATRMMPNDSYPSARRRSPVTSGLCTPMA